MAKVSLRIYNREIGTLVEQGQVDEAISHCHHILKTFPKHLETYRVLGKAYLEAKRYNDAGDIFSRVLTSVPNDFVSHAGMSMIADEKGKLDESIWHMQRAFEAQPSNAAVQSELQRLYGKRDGVEPAKIRMTSGALANVYVQGELYAQAIAEILSVEAKDPGRTDMQTLLANAYFRSGQRVEASQIASTLLTKSPYSFDANRILAEILPGTSRAEDTEIYRRRINALDPYTAFTKGSIFNAEEVPEAAVSLERLDWHPGKAPELSSGWEDSTGIKLDEEEQPDWLKGDGGTHDPEPASSSSAPTEESIPDFMRAAGWGDSSGEEEPTSFFDSPDPTPQAEETSNAEEIAQAEMPDWMKSMAPSGAALAAAETLEDDENEIGDDMASDEWVSDLLGDSEDEDKKPAETPKNDDGIEDDLIGSLGTSADDQDAAMNWLESLAANQGAKAEELITDPNARTESAPEWVEQAKDASTDAPLTEADDELAWLNEAATEDEPVAETSADLPDWMQESEDEPVAEIADDMPDWLQDAKEEPAAEAATDIPEWMQQEEAEATTEAAPPASETDQTLVSDSAIGELGASADDQDAAMNWLESLAANQGAKAEELITDPNARTESAPEWVEQAKDASTPSITEPGSAVEEPAPEVPPAEEVDDATPEWLQEEVEETTEAAPPASERDQTLVSDSTIGELGASADDQDAAMNWLESLAANQGAKAEELITDPNARTESAPEWVEQAKNASTASITEPASVTEEPALEAPPAEEVDDATPEWLQEEVEATTEAAPPASDTDQPLVSDSTIGELGASADDQDAAMNWLESLAANQGAKAEELITDPNARTESAPEWVEQAKNTSASAPVAEPASVVKEPDLESPPAEEVEDATPEWLQEEIEETTETTPPAPTIESTPVTEETPEMPDIATLETEGTETLEPELPSEVMMEDDKADDDTPTWIQEREASSDESLPPAAEATPTAEDDLPTWLENIEGSKSEEGEEEKLDEPLPDWMKAEEESSEPQPTQASEWQSTETKSKPESLPEAAPEAASSEEKTFAAVSDKLAKGSALPRKGAVPQHDVAPKEEVAPKQSEEKKKKEKISRKMTTAMLRDTTLMSAQAAMQDGDLATALVEYGKMVKKKRLLDEVIYDLREALDDYPVDVSLWQMLGDAYMRAGRLQEAIDAYTNAEKLLR